MNVADALSFSPVVLAEGSVIELLFRTAPDVLHPELLNAPLVLDTAGRAALAPIYERYLAAARDHGLPMLVMSPTWRANRERVERAGLGGRDLNGEAVRFLRGLRDANTGDDDPRVYVGGLLGCRGDAYVPAEALGRRAAASFHAWQAEALAGAGADFLVAETLPAISEALGLADALAATGTPYLVSFVVREDGRLLDGTPLGEAIDEIDHEAVPPPLGYLLNCVHPSVFRSAVLRQRDANPDAIARVLGLKANTSRLAPEELDGRAELDGMEPLRFAEEMAALHDGLGIRVLGGCCGTDPRHIEALAARLAWPGPGDRNMAGGV